MLIRIVEWILQQLHIGSLHRPKHLYARQHLHLFPEMNHQRNTHQFHLSFSQSRNLTTSRSFVAQNPTPHVHDSYEPHSSVGLKSVGGEPLVDRVKQPEVAREPAARADVGFGARFKYIEGAGEDEGELERGAQRLVRGLRGEYRYMEGVILCVVWSAVM